MQLAISEVCGTYAACKALHTSHVDLTVIVQSCWAMQNPVTTLQAAENSLDDCQGQAATCLI